MPNSLQAVILDVDGTLVDSNDAHAHAWVEALGAFGVVASFERVRPLIGMGGDKLLPLVAGISDEEPGGKEISARRAAIFREKYLPTLQAFPKVIDLLARMHGRGLHLVVASSAKADELGALLDVANVRGLIEARTSSDDAERSKPDPDVVAAALRRANVPAAHAIMLGDTPYDIEAAARVGIDTIALRCGGGWSDAELVGAVAIYDDPADLFERYDTSPFATRAAAA
jgi:HAD superfamily hydrolase (TIGR01509 family)